LGLLRGVRAHARARAARFCRAEAARRSRNYIRTCTAVEVRWLCEVAPHYYDLQNFPKCEAKVELERCYRQMLNERRAAA
jgi:hypothetical protein